MMPRGLSFNNFEINTLVTGQSMESKLIKETYLLDLSIVLIFIYFKYRHDKRSKILSIFYLFEKSAQCAHPY